MVLAGSQGFPKSPKVFTAYCKNYRVFTRAFMKPKGFHTVFTLDAKLVWMGLGAHFTKMIFCYHKNEISSFAQIIHVRKIHILNGEGAGMNVQIYAEISCLPTPTTHREGYELWSNKRIFWLGIKKECADLLKSHVCQPCQPSKGEGELGGSIS